MYAVNRRANVQHRDLSVIIRELRRRIRRESNRARLADDIEHGCRRGEAEQEDRERRRARPARLLDAHEHVAEDVDAERIQRPARLQPGVARFVRTRERYERYGECYGFDQYEAYFLLTQAGRVRLGNMVDPKYSLGASILKSYL